MDFCSIVFERCLGLVGSVVLLMFSLLPFLCLTSQDLVGQADESPTTLYVSLLTKCSIVDSCLQVLTLLVYLCTV